MQEEEKLSVRDEKPVSNGEWLMKTLKPAGCVIVLACMVLMIIVCLTAGRDPIKGYAPPQTDEYYSQHLDELQTELEANVFPVVEGVTSCEINGSVLNVGIEKDVFVTTRSAILRYYDRSLFEFFESD